MKGRESLRPEGLPALPGLGNPSVGRKDRPPQCQRRGGEGRPQGRGRGPAPLPAWQVVGVVDSGSHSPRGPSVAFSPVMLTWPVPGRLSGSSGDPGYYLQSRELLDFRAEGGRGVSADGEAKGSLCSPMREPQSASVPQPCPDLRKG